MARVGLWFEILLMGMLAAHAYNQDPASAHTQYALTEIGDETRHSVMFARWADKYGGEHVQAAPRRASPGQAVPAASRRPGPSMWAGTLVGRGAARPPAARGDGRRAAAAADADGRAHPRRSRRPGTSASPARNWSATMARARRCAAVRCCGSTRCFAALAAAIIAESLISPKVYEAAGLDRKQARRAARRNPNFDETKRWMAEKIVPFLDEVGMVNPVARFIYRRAHLLGLRLAPARRGAVAGGATACRPAPPPHTARAAPAHAHRPPRVRRRAQRKAAPPEPGRAAVARRASVRA